MFEDDEFEALLQKELDAKCKKIAVRIKDILQEGPGGAAALQEELEQLNQLTLPDAETPAAVTYNPLAGLRMDEWYEVPTSFEYAKEMLKRSMNVISCPNHDSIVAGYNQHPSLEVERANSSVVHELDKFYEIETYPDKVESSRSEEEIDAERDAKLIAAGITREFLEENIFEKIEPLHLENYLSANIPKNLNSPTLKDQGWFGIAYDIQTIAHTTRMPEGVPVVEKAINMMNQVVARLDEVKPNSWDGGELEKATERLEEWLEFRK